MAVDVFVEQLELSSTNEKVALVTFAGGGYASCEETNLTVSTDQGLTANMNYIRDAMHQRSTSIWNEMTDIKSGIQLANSILTSGNARASAEKVMIVFTDGVYTEDDPAEAAQGDDIMVNTITLVREPTRAT